MDPTNGVSLDHKFYEECPRHNFLSVCLSVCLSVWLAGCLEIFAFIKIVAFSG